MERNTRKRSRNKESRRMRLHPSEQIVYDNLEARKLYPKKISGRGMPDFELKEMYVEVKRIRSHIASHQVYTFLRLEKPVYIYVVNNDKIVDVVLFTDKWREELLLYEITQPMVVEFSERDAEKITKAKKILSKVSNHDLIMDCLESVMYEFQRIKRNDLVVDDSTLARIEQISLWTKENYNKVVVNAVKDRWQHLKEFEDEKKAILEKI